MSLATRIPATEAEWHEERRKGIGGSETHNLFPILNLADKAEIGSRYGCPRRLGYEKLGVEPDYQFTPETLRLFERGHAMEEYAARRYEKKTGLRVFNSNRSWTSERHPFMRCFIDRRIKIGDEGERAILECKSANEHVTLRATQEGLPIAYALQIQHSIEATESDRGDFAVIVVPDYVDAVIEQIEEGPLRSRILNLLAPNFEFFTFPAKRDDDMIGMIVEKEQLFWNLVQAKKLPDPLPELNDDRCQSCPFRKTCRGPEFVAANARIPVRDKKTGVQYAPIDSPDFVEAVRDRLQVMKEIEEQEEILAGITNEIKQLWPAEVGAVEIPGTGVKVRWGWQKGATRWDSDALKADSLTIGHKIAFADWVSAKSPQLVADFIKLAPGGEFTGFQENYQKQGAPTRPFVFSVKE